MGYMCRLNFFSIAFLVVFVSINLTASHTINGSAKTIDFTIDSPNGTQIDIKLSEYYNIPVATGSNGTYWYVAQSWHASEKIADLSTDIQRYEYPTSDYGPFSNSKIPMKISPLLILIFMGMAYYVSKKIV